MQILIQTTIKLKKGDNITKNKNENNIKQELKTKTINNTNKAKDDSEMKIKMLK